MCFYVASDPYTDLVGLESSDEYKIVFYEVFPREELTEFLVSEGSIFVYYEHEGLVNRYTDTGEFCYGIQVRSSDHGEGAIAYSAGRLYIVGPGAFAYAFKDTTLVELYSYTDNPTEYLQLRTIASQNDSPYVSDEYKYVATSNAIIRYSESQGSEVVISFPKENNSLELSVIALAAAVMGLVLCVCRQNANGKTGDGILF